MKMLIKGLASLLLAGVVILPLVSGCAGDRTKQSTGEYLDDAAVTSKVKAAFLKDPDVKGLAVKVKTYKGEVQLSGFVATQNEKDRAGEIARTINGVRWVINDIQVK